MNDEELIRSLVHLLVIKEALLLTPDASVEEKATVCRKCFNAEWAFKHQGRFYCFMQGEMPSCATNHCKNIRKDWYSSDHPEGEDITAKHYGCGPKNFPDN